MTERILNDVYIATSGLPLFDVNKGDLGTRQDDDSPIVLATTVNAPQGIDLDEYIYGMYLRNIPTRSMLRYVNEEIDKRNQLMPDENKTYVSGFVGPPGTGKTHFFTFLANATDARGPMLIDCSGKDLRSIFEETVFDAGSANEERAAIDAKIKLHNMKSSGAISQESLDVLASLLGDAYSVDDKGFISIDWKSINIGGKDIAEHEYNNKVMQRALKDICKKENIEISSGAFSVGVKTRDGELVRALDKTSPDYGRPIILDELNRAKPGTMDNLYGVLNFFNSPNMKTFTVQGANGKEIFIDKNNLPKTFYINFTGNQAVQGMGSQSFNDPFLSRIPEGFALHNIPENTAEDFADMVSSYLLGVSGTIIADSFKFANDHQFVDFIKQAREMGLSAKQKAQIPVWQQVNMANAVNIVKMSRMLGGFFYDIKNLTNLQGAFKNIENSVDIPMTYQSLLEKKTIDFRIIPYFFTQADILKSVATKSAPVLLGVKKTSGISKEDINPFAKRGDRLVNVITTWLEDTFIPGDMAKRQIEEESVDAMIKQAYAIAKNHNIIESNNKEASSSGNSLAKLYNTKYELPDQYAKKMRKAIIGVLSIKYPELKEDAEEDIISIQTMNETINALKTISAEESFISLNEDVDDLSAMPVIRTQIIQNGAQDNQETSNLINNINFFFSLGIKASRKANLDALMAMSKKGLDENQDYAYLFNNSLQPDSECPFELGVFETSKLNANNKDEVSINLIFYNKNNQKTLTVGDKIPDSIKKLYANENHNYIDRTRTDKDIFNLIFEKTIGEIDLLTETSLETLSEHFGMAEFALAPSAELSKRIKHKTSVTKLPAKNSNILINKGVER